MAQGTARLLISCPDRKGIISAVAGFIASHNGNILEADQHTDPNDGMFFMRVEVELQNFELSRDTFNNAWLEISHPFNMQWSMHWGDQKKRMAIMVSKQSHCLNDLLWRWKTGELQVDVAFVASNHTELKEDVVGFGIPFYHLPVCPETKQQQESQLLTLLKEQAVDVIVLARYMQILSPSFVEKFPERMINIHHSFLPAFAGPKPYHQAYERGVKIIGATSHYVTDQLDRGPIIAQSTLSVDHRDTVDDLVRKGRDLERVVLASAVRYHVEDQLLISNNKTVVFD